MILHVSTPIHWRGGEQQVAYLVQGLAELGIDQVALCPAGSALAQRLVAEDLPVTTFNGRGFLGISLAKRIAALVASHPVTHIHCHDAHAHTAAVIANHFFGANKPLIVSRRVAFPVSKNPLSKWKYNHNSVKYIICVSQIVLNTVRHAIRDTSKLTVIYDGIDIDRYAHKPEIRKLVTELGLEKGVKLIGNLSALSDSKDFPTFLQVAKQICQQYNHARFIIAGEGPERKRIEKTIDELTLRNKVFLLGFREDVVDVMQSLDVFLFTSTVEGLGTIVLEAFAGHIPVVATSAGGIPELVEDRKTGMLAVPGNVEELSKHISLLLSSPDMKNKITEAAFEKVQSFGYQRTAAQTLAVYQKTG